MTESSGVAELKQPEHALQLTRFSVQVAAEAMFTVAPDGRILSANETACERLEYTQDELTRMNVADIDPHYPVEVWPGFLEEIRRNRKMILDTQHITKSGRILEVEVSVAYINFEGAEFFCSSVRDVTVRKQTERILHLQQNVLAKIASAPAVLTETLNELCQLVEALVPDSMATVMLIDESDGNLRFEAGPQLTASICGMFEPLQPGLESGSCGGAAFLKRPVIVEDTRISPHWRNLQHIVEELNLLACWSLPILDDHDQALGTFAVSHHRTCAPTAFQSQILETASHLASLAICRKRSERQLRSAHEELAHVSRLCTIGELASSIGHELNQPLAALVSYAYLLEQETQEEPPDLPGIQMRARKIRQQADRAGDIVATVRKLVKKSAPTRTAANLNDVVCESLVLLEPELRQHAVTIDKQLEAELPTLQVDSVQIQQVLVNLIRNSVEAMLQLPRAERCLTIATALTASQEIEICVSDTGEGLPEEGLEAVFDAFHTTKQEGMGMGLTICRAIAEAHDGRLTAANASGRGAVFCLTLPHGL